MDEEQEMDLPSIQPETSEEQQALAEMAANINCKLEVLESFTFTHK